VQLGAVRAVVGIGHPAVELTVRARRAGGRPRRHRRGALRRHRSVTGAGLVTGALPAPCPPASIISDSIWSIFSAVRRASSRCISTVVPVVGPRSESGMRIGMPSRMRRGSALLLRPNRENTKISPTESVDRV